MQGKVAGKKTVIYLAVRTSLDNAISEDQKAISILNLHCKAVATRPHGIPSCSCYILAEFVRLFWLVSRSDFIYGSICRALRCGKDQLGVQLGRGKSTR